MINGILSFVHTTQVHPSPNAYLSSWIFLLDTEHSISTGLR